MKKFTMFLASVATALFGFTTTASAQYETEQQIPWVNHASTLDEALNAPNGIYLCYMQTETAIRHTALSLPEVGSAHRLSQQTAV